MLGTLCSASALYCLSSPADKSHPVNLRRPFHFLLLLSPPTPLSLASRPLLPFLLPTIALFFYFRQHMVSQPSSPPTFFLSLLSRFLHLSGREIKLSYFLGQKKKPKKTTHTLTLVHAVSRPRTRNLRLRPPLCLLLCFLLLFFLLLLLNCRLLACCPHLSLLPSVSLSLSARIL